MDFYHLLCSSFSWWISVPPVYSLNASEKSFIISSPLGGELNHSTAFPEAPLSSWQMNLAFWRTSLRCPQITFTQSIWEESISPKPVPFLRFHPTHSLSREWFSDVLHRLYNLTFNNDYKSLNSSDHSLYLAAYNYLSDWCSSLKSLSTRMGSIQNIFFPFATRIIWSFPKWTCSSLACKNFSMSLFKEKFKSPDWVPKNPSWYSPCLPDIPPNCGSFVLVTLCRPACFLTMYFQMYPLFLMRWYPLFLMRCQVP